MKHRSRSPGASRKYHDRVAKKYDAIYDDDYWRFHDRLTWDAIKPHLPRDANARCCDLGCGTGKWGLKVLKSGFPTTFVDNSAAMIEQTRAKLEAFGPRAKSATLLVADIVELAGLEPDQFDLEPLTKMRMKPVPTDHCLTHGHERGVDVGPFFVTDSQSAILMQPTQRTLHRPAGFAKTTSVRAVASGQQRAAATLTQRLSVRFGVIRPVSLHHLEPPARPARFARDLWNRIDQRQQLRDVVAVGRRQEGNHRRAVAIGQYMVLGTVFPAIYRARTRFFPPCTARTEAESTKARDQSMAFDRRNRFSNSPCSFVQTPRWFQSRSRRQQLMPLPHPISWGRYSHGMPVLSTNRIPDNAARSSSGGRPRFPGPLRCLGSRGRINSQSSSVTNGLVIKPSMAKTKPYCPINHKHGEVHFC